MPEFYTLSKKGIFKQAHDRAKKRARPSWGTYGLFKNSDYFFKVMNNSYASFSDYSYALFAANGPSQLFGGTGFFAAYNDRLYLLTNSHVFPGWDPLKGNWPHDRPHRIMFIESVDKTIGRKVVFPMDLTQVSKNWHHFTITEHPDIFMLDVTTQKFPTGFIATALQLNDTPRQANAGDIVFSFGYPVANRNPSPSVPNGISFVQGKYNNDYSDLNKLGLIFQPAPGVTNADIGTRLEELNFYFDGISMEGCSGSPVFLQTDQTPVFAGLLTGNYDDFGKSVCVRADVIIAYLKLINELRLPFSDFNLLPAF